MEKEISISKLIKFSSFLLVILQIILFSTIILIVNYPEEVPNLERKVTIIAIISIGLTVFFGNMFVFLSIKYISKPLKVINRDLEKAIYGNTVDIPKTRIKEFNTLINSVEKLAQSALRYSSTLSLAIDRFSIGLFFTTDRKNVFCTQSFFDICELDEMEGNYRYHEFQGFLRKITARPHPDIASTYQIGENKWVHVTTNEDKLFLLGIVNDSTEQVLHIERLEKERDFDHLTGLYVRPAFIKEAEKFFVNPEGKVMALIMWDIDKLKMVNDTYGHEFGDKYLVNFSEAIKSLEKYGALVSRRSGDEFWALVPGESHMELINIINEVRTKIHETFVEVGEGTYERLKASMGIAWYPDDGKDLETLINVADFSLYEMKFNLPEINPARHEEVDPAVYKLHYNQEFQKIIEGDCLTFAYQPIVDARTGEVFGYEMLMRIFSEIIVTPRKLIAIGKLYSKLHLIEDTTFNRAFEEYDSHLADFKGRKVFINSFAGVLLTEKTLKKVSKPFNNKLDMLVVELIDINTSEEDSLRQKQEQMQDLEAKIAVDNFDGDFDHLEHADLHVDFLKIDMSVVSNINKDFQHQKILGEILDYAKARDIKTVAVGVKNFDEMKYLVEAGLDYLQGFYIGHPKVRPGEISPDLVKKIRNLHK